MGAPGQSYATSVAHCLQTCFFIFAERNGVRGNTEIQRLFNMSMSAIRQEIETNHAPLKGDVTVLDTLLNKIPTFRYVVRFRSPDRSLIPR